MNYANFAVCVLRCGAVTAAADAGIAVVAPDGSVTGIPYTALKQMRLQGDGVNFITASGENEIRYTDIDRININAQLSTVDEITAGGNMAVWLSEVGSVLDYDCRFEDLDDDQQHLVLQSLMYSGAYVSQSTQTFTMTDNEADPSYTLYVMGVDAEGNVKNVSIS